MSGKLNECRYSSLLNVRSPQVRKANNSIASDDVSFDICIGDMITLLTVKVGCRVVYRKHCIDNWTGACDRKGSV